MEVVEVVVTVVVEVETVVVEVVEPHLVEERAPLGVTPDCWLATVESVELASAEPMLSTLLLRPGDR